MRARKRWSIRVGAALAPDSNVSSQTDERTILLDTPIGRLPFSCRSDGKPQSGGGVAVWAGGENTSTCWKSAGGCAQAAISRAAGTARSDEFDRMLVAAHLGPRWLIGRAIEASLLARGRQSWLTDETDYRDLGLRVERRHRFNRRTTASLNASRNERRYGENTWFDVRSPTSRRGSAGRRHRPCASTQRWAGGARGRNASAISHRWVQLGTTALLPRGLLTVGGAGTLRWADYRSNWSPFVLGGRSRRT